MRARTPSSNPTLTLGVSGSQQGPAAALVGVDVLAACEENRLTRSRLREGGSVPSLAVSELLGFLDHTTSSIRSVATTGGGEFTGREATAVDHHLAHAAYAFHSSPFDDAVVVVCDGSVDQGWTAWRATNTGLTRVDDPLGTFPIANLYSQLTTALGLSAGQHEHIVEALARVGTGVSHPASDAITVGDAGLVTTAGWLDLISAADGERGTPAQVAAASAVQARLADALIELLVRIQRATGASRACLVGGLFYNTHFTTAAATRGPFAEVFVPPHPGDAGSALGAALVETPDRPARNLLSSPFLGPGYSLGRVKETLDNCKLSYSLPSEDRLLEGVVDALARGWLVGWFEGRMEWGPRALGHRSVLASPGSAHVLDNLNGFLKQRPWYRAYGVSVPLQRVQELFEGPASAPYMQFEYRPRNPERFLSILPRGASTIRVHTVDDREPRLLRLLNLWEQRSGSPMLVNTSFNGFHEPLVCTPRDAVRVFYGTGLDMLAVEGFLLSK